MSIALGLWLVVTIMMMVHIYLALEIVSVLGHLIEWIEVK